MSNPNPARRVEFKKRIVDNCRRFYRHTRETFREIVVPFFVWQGCDSSLLWKDDDGVWHDTHLTYFTIDDGRTVEFRRMPWPRRFEICEPRRFRRCRVRRNWVPKWATRRELAK